MQKIVFTIFLLIAAGNFGCGTTSLMQNQDVAGVQPTLTTSPTPINGRPSQEFLEHFNKGVELSTDFHAPDNQTKAIEEFRKAGEIDPKDTVVYWRMVEVYGGLKDYNGMVESYREILRRNPEETNAQYKLAQVLVEDLKNYDEGLKEALIAQDKKASYPFLIEKLIGEAYEGKGDIPNAIKHYKIYAKGYRIFTKENDKEIEAKITELEKSLQNSNTNQK